MEEDRQHQIPQQISSYQFRLVGDMTLQQFFQVASGAIIALILYSSTLPGFIKWPLVLISFLTGVAFAFFPIEDRPLQKWIVLLLKAVYSPTLFVWKQNPNTTDYFQKEEITLPETTANDVEERSTQNQPEYDLGSAQQYDGSQNGVDVQLTTAASQTHNDPATTIQQDKKEVEIPTTEQVEVEKESDEDTSEKIETQEPTIASDITPTATRSSIGSAKQARFNQDSGPPNPPTKPNVIVGQVLGPSGEIIENAILEIKDSEGRSVRALKTNRLGHFMIVTELANGMYELVTEKEGMEFDNIKVEIKGEIVPPIAIWALKNDNDRTATKVNDPNKSLSQQNPTENVIYNQEGQK